MDKIKVIISWSGDNYAATCTEVNGAVIVTNKTFEGVKRDFESAFKFHIKGSVADGDDIPDNIKKGKYTFDYELHVSAILHDLDGLVTRAALSRMTGINEKQLGHYLSGFRRPRPEQREKIISGVHKLGRRLIAVV
jgi:predicted RNase H-like HicB family nuclease